MKNLRIKELRKRIAHLERRLQHYANHAPDERLLFCYTAAIWEEYFKLSNELRELEQSPFP